MTTPRFRTIILNSMARTLWVEAYMTEVGELAGEANDPTVEINPKAVEIQRSAIGHDWMDLAPQTPEAATTLAVKLCSEVEKLSEMTLEDGFTVALVADLARNEEAREVMSVRPVKFDQDATCPAVDLADKLANTFGHYLVMEALGHGVAWEDDHAEMPLKMPFSFDNYELHGLVKL